MYPKTAFWIYFFPLQTANVTYFQRKIQLSWFSAYPDVSPSQLIWISGVLPYFIYVCADTHCHVNKKVQLDATVCRHLFTAQSLYMFRVSQYPSSGVLKTLSATSGIGHDAGTATSFHRGLIRIGTPDDGCCDTRNM